MKIELIVIAAILVPLIVGLLLGMLRGSRRATLRILLIILCVVLAFCLKDAVTVGILNAQFDGQTIQQIIANQLPEEYASMTDTVMPIIALIVSAVVFLLLFLLLQFVTWAIVYPICKIFVKKARKKKDGTYGRKHGLIGGVIGLAQGAVVAFVLCVILNGLFVNIGNVAETMSNENGSQNGGNDQAIVLAEGGNGDQDTSTQPTDPTNMQDTLKMFIDYKQSSACKFVSKISFDNKAFDLVASMKTEDGRKLTLTGQIDALSGLVKMGKQLSELQNADLSGGLSGATAEQVADIFKKLDEINASLSDESKDTINTLVQTVASQMLPDMNLDLSNLDFKTISFANEGEVITKLSGYKDADFSTLTEEQAKQQATDIVNTVMQSDIILPLLSSNSEFTIGLTGDNYDFAKNVIEELEQNPESDKDKVEMLKSFFGLNDETSGGNGGTTTPEQPVEPAPEQPSEPDTPEVSE